MRKTKKYIYEVFSLDLTSLAIFRISFGFVLLANIIIRASHLEHYINEGVLPLSQAIKDAGPLRISLYYLNGSQEYQIFLILLSCVFVVCFIVGYKTKVATILSWIFFLSICNRNIWVNSGADILIRIFLFWSMFLPLERRFSLDSKLHTIKNTSSRIFSIATITFILQVNFIYLFTALWKIDPMWITKGNAISYALQNTMFVTSFGEYVKNHFSWSLPFITLYVFILESVGFYFIYFPKKNDTFRTVTVFLFIALHTGIGITMNLGTFSPAIISVLIALLPNSFWQKFKFAINKHIQKKPLSYILVPKENKAIQLFLILCISYVFLFNLYSLSLKDKSHNEINRINSQSVILRLAYLIGLQQTWDMFAPRPPTVNYWYVIAGKKQNGILVDLRNPQKSLNFTEKFSIYTTNETYFQLQYNNSLTPDRYDFFTRYYCNEWNKVHKDKSKLVFVKLFRLSEKINNTNNSVMKALVYTKNCITNQKKVL